jgi:hypothetical protein
MAEYPGLMLVSGIELATMAKRSVVSRVRMMASGAPRTRREVRASLHLLASLRAHGWHRSLNAGTPMNALGEPQPWLTYPVVRWLETVLTPATRVFEYGAGSSTAWFARPGRIKEIISVEHDAGWFAALPQPPNGRILHIPFRGTWWDAGEDSPYVRAIADGAPWDVVVVDGMARTACARLADTYLSAAGLVILDDTDKPESVPAQEALTSRGLGRLDFWGLKPGLGTQRCTTVFGRDINAWVCRN